MYANKTATRSGVDRRLIAGLFVGIIVATSLAFLMDHDDRFGFASPPGDGNSPTASGRDPLLWPFSRDSVWNLPIGADAQYVHAGIRSATQMAYFTDADVLILEPNAPATTVYTNYDDWGSGTRCDAQGPALFTAPIPSDFIVPGSHQGSEDGDTPNAATAILAADGHTLIQTQPFAKCAGYAPTSHYMFGSEDLYGTGETGSHGGSGLSALGGTVRLGELVPGGIIPHALKMNIDNVNFYSGTPHGSPAGNGYRWPAWKSDGYGYTGSNPAVAPGSLLAVKGDFDIAGLETEPGRIVAQAFLNYGGYIVDSSGWSIYNFVTEHSPKGSVRQEFQRVWGYDMSAGVGANGWARDLMKIFTNLHAVDNWDHATWQTVSASGGSLGVGLGAPRAAWAPGFGEAPPPPPPPPPGLVATTLTLTTSENPSEINETVTVSGRLVDASGVPVAGRNVVLEWSADQTTWYPESQIGQFPITGANGDFTGSMAFRGIGAHQEYLRARFAGDATYASSLSPVLTQGVGAAPVPSPTDPGAPTEPPAQPGPAPISPFSNPETVMILGLVGLILAAGAGLQYRRVRMNRPAAKKGRSTARSNPKQPLRVSFADPSDELDLPL
jgi:hypothetical protein